MKKFDTRVYNVADFLEWHRRDQLELSPDFQRRSVWTTKAKSYLIDTILRGKPMPKILLTQDIRDRKARRIVVDGQQRLRTILEFAEGAFAISSAHSKELARKKFDTLPEDLQSEFMKYEVGVDLLYDVPYADLLDIFARLNTYTVRLNDQELLNAKYVGYFKQLAYELGFAYVGYFIEAGIFTKAQATRMAEAELSSDLLASLINGVQTNKGIEAVYREYEDELPKYEVYEQRFHQVMSFIGEIYPAAELKETNWARIHLFYSLFTSIAHGLFGLENLKPQVRPKITKKLIPTIRLVLDEVSAKYDQYTEDESSAIPKDYERFIDRSRRRTTDTGSRTLRAEFICRKLISAI